MQRAQSCILKVKIGKKWVNNTTYFHDVSIVLTFYDAVRSVGVVQRRTAHVKQELCVLHDPRVSLCGKKKLQEYMLAPSHILLSIPSNSKSLSFEALV